MKKRQIFDAHHHLWDLDQCHYPWLMAKGVKRFFGDPAPIQKNYLVADFRKDAAAFELVGSTHIQVGVEEPDAVKETKWLQAQSDSDSLPNAIVSFADLSADNIDEILTKHAQSENFRGIRQIVGRHPGEDAATGTGDLIEDPRFLRGLKLLERKNLSFDLQLIEANYEGAIRLFLRLPELRLAICHFASPWDLSLDGYMRWRSAMKEFAALPLCRIKFSGFGMFKPDWTAKDIKPFVETALELFGEDRCMAGSNFPVDKLYGGYDRIWRALEELTVDESLLRKITVTNGANFYDVDLAS
ncbi:MAG: amidohydrolase family protein [Pseudomonadota bacterium]